MEKLENLIKYLDGEVNNEEKHLIETEIESNSELKDTINLIKETDSIIKDTDLFNFTNAVLEISSSKSKNNTLNNRKTIMVFFGKKFLLAASLLLLVILSSILIYTAKPSSDNLYAQYYSRYDACYITRGNSETDALVLAIQLYDKKQYSDAISHFNKILKTDTKNTAAYFFIGISYMEVNSYEKAIESLNIVIAQKDTAFLEHAEWYLALCYLKTNKVNLAKNILNQIAVSDNYYHSQAIELTRKLK
jgi:tetratricopeptide (TPR) repeat protein